MENIKESIESAKLNQIQNDLKPIDKFTHSVLMIDAKDIKPIDLFNHEKEFENMLGMLIEPIKTCDNCKHFPSEKCFCQDFESWEFNESFSKNEPILIDEELRQGFFIAQEIEFLFNENQRLKKDNSEKESDLNRLLGELLVEYTPNKQVEEMMANYEGIIEDRNEQLRKRASDCNYFEIELCKTKENLKTCVNNYEFLEKGANNLILERAELYDANVRLIKRAKSNKTVIIIQTIALVLSVIFSSLGIITNQYPKTWEIITNWF